MKRLVNAVDKHKKLILDAERYIWKNPETGYKEFKTTAYLAEKYRELGYILKMPADITGFVTEIDTGIEGPTVLILGELDSIICPGHPESDKETGAVHSCGHNAQSATLLGIAAALKEDGVLEGLCGKIRLCAVPAEELLETEYRQELKKQGKIKYYSGKTEFLSRGYFDGVDIAFMVHTSQAVFATNLGSVGSVVKNITYKGKASHAGGDPWNGINALYAANCGINAVNSLRETFNEADIIRFHPIITHGGSMVNAIPEKVSLESYVRGKTFDAITRENKKINRALIGAALSMGANIDITDIPGYTPLTNDKNMINLATDALRLALPEEKIYNDTGFGSGSTDMGDLSCLMPVVHPYAPGACGTSHGSDYYIDNPELACVKNAKWQLAMVKLLLENGASRAKKIISDFKPLFPSKEKFLSYIDSLASSGDKIIYNNDGTATVAF